MDLGRRAQRVRWTSAAPSAAVVILAAIWGTKPGTAVLVLAGLFLAASVLAAVHHAEVIAHRVGEPFGSLVLAVAVTIIEVALIVTLMISGGDETSTLARDTVFAAVMITCTGIVGLSLLFATLKHGVATFNAEGTASAWRPSRRSPPSASSCRRSRRAARDPSSPRRSSRSPPSRRSLCTGSSCSCRRCDIATTSCRQDRTPAIPTNMPRRRPTGKQPFASFLFLAFNP